MDAYEQAMEYIRPGGCVCAVGLPPGELKINVFDKVVQRKNFVTSYVGSRADAVEALQIVAEGHVSQPIVVEPLDNIQDIYDRMAAGKILGRVVVDCEFCGGPADDECGSSWGVVGYERDDSYAQVLDVSWIYMYRLQRSAASSISSRYSSDCVRIVPSDLSVF
jgi:hypothetical protein